MTYFEEVHDLPVYPSDAPNFRFTYNSNSGGGNSFLAGKPVAPDGERVSATALDGKNGVLRYDFINAEHERNVVILEDASVTYEIKPRGVGGTQMKLGVDKKENPSKAIAAFLMLPEGCGVRRTANRDQSILSRHNYWLQEMRLDWVEDSSRPGIALLKFSNPIFGGGVGEGDASTTKPRYFKLDVERRIRDIIEASQRDSLPVAVRRGLQLFSEIYTGRKPFRYRDARDAADELMRETASILPASYSGIGDPLPALMQMPPSANTGIPQIQNSLSRTESRNRIVFGAPGTGKSYQIDCDREALLADGGEFERITFHPDYTYASFVGTYKPVVAADSNSNETITYKYVAGPFMRTLAAALRNGRTGVVLPHLLVIEEINRASPAAVFGDVFQLLDRNDENTSQYPIHSSADMQNYLSDVVGGEPADYKELRIPGNMFIWGSMNSADQGVFHMDTAFKRRWDFVYTGINDNDAGLRGKVVTLGSGESERTVEWNELRKVINDFLASKGINEDKQLGPYFLSRSITVPEDGTCIDREKFIEAFQQKVLMYLFEDAARQHRASLFEGCRGTHNRYSDICREFEEHGVEIFNREIITRLSQSPAPTPLGLALAEDSSAPDQE